MFVSNWHKTQVMETYKQWFKTRSHTLLPTTFKPKGNSTVSDNLVDGVSWLWQTLIRRKNHENILPNSSSDFSENMNKKLPKSASGNFLVHAAFPSYLNTEGTHRKSTPQCYRRSSLLVGCEQTMHFITTSKKQTRLVLPKDNEGSTNSQKELIEHAHLPVPVVQPPRFKVPNTLYGYLDESTFKKGLGCDYEK